MPELCLHEKLHTLWLLKKTTATYVPMYQQNQDQWTVHFQSQSASQSVEQFLILLYSSKVPDSLPDAPSIGHHCLLENFIHDYEMYNVLINLDPAIAIGCTQNCLCTSPCVFLASLQVQHHFIPSDWTIHIVVWR